MRLTNAFVWSLMGNTIPMVAALLAVPFLLQTLGQERFGVLSLIWVLIGYFSFLDMGIGRALTVAVALNQGSTPVTKSQGGTAISVEAMKLVSTATIFLGVLATIVALFTALAIIYFDFSIEFTSKSFEREVVVAILFMLPSLPLLLIASALRGYLEGISEFRMLNILRIPTGVLLVAAPCLTSWYYPSLINATISLLLVRFINTALLIWMTNRAMGNKSILSAFLLPKKMAGNISGLAMKKLIIYGGWATVSNIVGPVIIYIDRFVIVTVLGAGAVAIYSVPFDIVSRLPILVASLCSVLLPIMAQLSKSIELNAANPAVLQVSNTSLNVTQLGRLVARSTSISTLVVVPIVALGCMVTPFVLNWWLGESFASKAVNLTQILLVAFGINAIAQIPFTALQAISQVKSIAVLHLCELVPYTCVVYIAVLYGGLIGAAYAWLLRGTVDYIIMTWIWRRHEATLRRNLL